ncbi:hypothetical protein H0H92_012377, partial [Tricholoma furcatifolium]
MTHHPYSHHPHPTTSHDALDACQAAEMPTTSQRAAADPQHPATSHPTNDPPPVPITTTTTTTRSEGWERREKREGKRQTPVGGEPR